MGYIFLTITIIAESIAIILMKLSQGFQHKGYATASIITYVISFIFFTLALKHLPAGTANALWAGASTILVAVLSFFIFKEQFSWLQLFYLALIIAGIVGLQYNSPAN